MMTRLKQVAMDRDKAILDARQAATPALPPAIAPSTTAAE
jgi:hypothetical protein